MKRQIILAGLGLIGSVLAAPCTDNLISRRWSDMTKAIPRARFGLASETSVLTKRAQESSDPAAQYHPRPRLGFAYKALVDAFPSRPSLSRRWTPETSGIDALKKLLCNFVMPFGTTVNTPVAVRKLSLNAFDLHHSKVILPLKRIQDLRVTQNSSSNQSLHPYISFQLRVNRALRRHAYFLKRTISDQDLIHNLRKRANAIGFDLELRHEPTMHQPQKRGLHLRERHNTGHSSQLNASTNLEVMPDTVSTSTSTGFNTKKLNALIDNVITSPGKPTAANSVGFSIEANDVAYFITIEVGTPPQNFNVIMDSGSSDFWLAGPKCTNSNTGENTCGHKSLTTDSSSYKPTSTPFQVSYGTGQVSGVLVQEDVNLAGLTLAGHTFGAATSESDDFAAATVPFDGLMGTALSTLSSEKVLTPIESLAKSGKISGAFMGYSLGRSADNSNMGQVTVGGVDANKFEGSLTLIDNVNTKGFWEGAMTKVTVNGKTVLENKTGILDTGTTLIICPPDDAIAVHSAIPGSKSDSQGGFTLPCNTQATVALNFGGKDFSILASDLAVQPVNTDDLEGDCMSGISSGQIGGANQWLLGDVFLKNVYLATDATNNQIGLAVIKSGV